MIRLQLVCALLFALAACGGEPTVAEGGASDTATDAAFDAALDDAGTDAADDAAADDAVADVPEDSEQDVEEDAGREADTETDTGADVSEDAGDAGDVSTDATVDAPDADRPRIPLADFVPCEDSIDCPNGTGNCITELSFTRETAGTPATISIAELDPDWPASGVCSRDCGTSPDVCAELSFSRVPPNIETPYTCMLVALGEAPYPELDGLPDPASLDPAEQELGVPFAALCVPPLHEMEAWPADFGQLCTSASPCSEGSACWLDEPFAEEVGDDATGACLATCGEGDTCPFGFACEEVSDAVGATVGDVSGRFCLPLERTFTGCRDADDDDFGAGQCDGALSSQHDCDDTLWYAWFAREDMEHGFPAWCGEDLDVNCNGVPDDAEQLGTSSVEGEGFGYAHCTACDLGCAGEVPNGERRCEGGASAPACVALCATDEGGVPTHADCDLDVETGCEVAIDGPGRLFLPDCDGDGVGNDEPPTFACSDDLTFERDGEACAAVPAFTNTGTAGEPAWEATARDCADDEGARYGGNAEVCDGLDNDCDGTPDNLPRLDEADLTCVAAALGECANGTLACRPELSEDVTCVPASPQAEVCDGLDNDCDGAADNTIVDGEGAEVPVSSRPDATGLIGATGEACTAPESSDRLGICRDGLLACDSAARELTCAYNEPTEVLGEVILERSEWSAGIVAPFSTSAPSWYVNPSGIPQSADIGDLESSTLTLTLDLAAAARLEALYVVSSERNFDWLVFSVDGELQERVSGSEDGTFSAVLEAGTRVVTFTYAKDVSQSELGDFALIPRVSVETIAELDWPGDGLDTSCDGFDGSLASGIFVAGFGFDTTNGGYEAPVRSFARALEIQEADAARRQIYLGPGAAVAVEGPVLMPSVSGLFGGYTVSDDVWSPGGSSTVNITLPEQATGPWTPAVLVEEPQRVELRDVDFSVVAVGDDVTNVAVLECAATRRFELSTAAAAESAACQNLSLTSVELEISAGVLDGADGWGASATSTDGVPPPSDTYNISPVTGRLGASATCDTFIPSVGALVSPTRSETNGTNGGFRPAELPSWNTLPASNYAGFFPLWLSYTTALIGNTSEDEVNSFNLGYAQPPWGAQSGGGKRFGADGAIGVDATLPVGPSAQVASNDPLAPISGHPGTSGANGFGGYGGAAGAWQYANNVTSLGFDWLLGGGAGEGGGAGGCGGSGGSGGEAGGTAVGLAVSGRELPSLNGVSVAVNGGSAGGGGSGHPGAIPVGVATPSFVGEPHFWTLGTITNITRTELISLDLDDDTHSTNLSNSGLDESDAPRGSGGRGGCGAPGTGGNGGQGGSAMGVYHYHGTLLGSDGDGVTVTSVVAGAAGAQGAGGSILSGDCANASPDGNAGPAAVIEREQYSRGENGE